MTDFLWNTLEDYPVVDKVQLFEGYHTIVQMDKKTFDQGNFSEYVTKCLLVTQQLVLAYLEEPATDLIVDVAEVLIQQKEFTIVHIIGDDKTDLFEHPLILHELEVQKLLLERLAAGPSLTAQDKKIFRPQ